MHKIGQKAEKLPRKHFSTLHIYRFCDFFATFCDFFATFGQRLSSDFLPGIRSDGRLPEEKKRGYTPLHSFILHSSISIIKGNNITNTIAYIKLFIFSPPLLSYC